MRALLTLVVFALGCASTQPTPTGRVPRASFDGVGILRTHLAASTDLFSDARSPDELKDALRGTRGVERRTLQLQRAVALSDAMQGAEARDARRMRRDIDRIFRPLRRVRADAEAARIAFVELWVAWRTGRSNAPRLAERYTTRHREAGGDLVYVAWLIKGEIDAEADEWDDARRSYRFLLGSLAHPLYGFALLRTGHAQREAGEADEARRTLEEVVALSCQELTDAAQQVVRVAAAEIDARLIEGRATDCAGQEVERGVDELPPGFRDDAE